MLSNGEKGDIKMIESIAGGFSLNGAGGGQTASLNESQRSRIAELLQSYDPERLSQGDGAAIVESLKEIGAKPGIELGRMLVEHGYDPFELAESAGVSRATAAGGSAALTTEAIETLMSIVQSYDLGDLSEADKREIAERLRGAGFDAPAGGGLIDVRV